MSKKTIAIIIIAIIAVIIILLLIRKRITGAIMKKLEFVDNQKMRNDSQGLGSYHAPRKTRLHDGVDIITTPGQIIKAPRDLTIVRRAKPGSGSLDGLLVELDTGERIKIFYVAPVAYTGNYKKGETIAIAQDIAPTYNSPGMINHAHIEYEDKTDITNRLLLL